MAKSDTPTPQPGADEDGFGGDAPEPAALVDTSDEVVPGTGAETIDGGPRAGELVEPAEPVEQADLETVELELLHHWTTADGEAVAPGSTVRVDTEVADQLLQSGYAQSVGAGESQGEPAPE